jgi:hypothetical protein
MLEIDMKNRNTMSMSVPRDDIEITHFRNYVLKVEGTEITSKNSQDKKLILNVGKDNVLYVQIIGSGKEPVQDYSYVYASVPNGYRKVHQTEAAKTIRGVKGKYLYFRNPESDYIAYAVGSGGKEYKIPLGKINDKDSKLRVVLDNLPGKPFHKADLNSILPPVIIENRQPIKAALDILELEGYLKKTGKKIGISEEFVKTNKIPPKTVSQIKLVEDNEVTKKDGR